MSGRRATRQSSAADFRVLVGRLHHGSNDERIAIYMHMKPLPNRAVNIAELSES
jgi:hypothetical protein